MAGFKPPINYRSAASRTPTPEPFTVSGGVALLAEAPADPGDASTPMVVTVGGQARSRVTSTPGVGQFMVRTATSPLGTAFLPLLELNAADEGLSGACDYYRTGTVYTAEWFAFLLSFVSPITGLASKAALDAACPATSDATQHGRPGRIAFLTDQSAWFSDGTAWRQISGTSVITAADALYAAAFGVTADAIASHVGAMTAAASFAHSQDATWAPPGSLTGDIQAAVTLAAALDAVFVGAGLTADMSVAATLAATLDATWSAAASGPTPVAMGTAAYASGTTYNTASITPGMPAGWAIGDQLFLVASDNFDPNWVSATPSGWTKIGTASKYALFVKNALAQGGETAPTLTATTAQMFAIRGCASAGTAALSGSATLATATGAVTPVTTADADTLLVMVAAYFGIGSESSDPNAAGPTATGTVNSKMSGSSSHKISAKSNSYHDVCVFTAAQAVAGASGSQGVTWPGTCSTTNTYTTFLLALKKT